MGAVNCIKHRDLCRLLMVNAYPTLIALNSPGGPQGTATNPAITKIMKKKNTFESVLDAIKDEFPGAMDAAAVADAEVVARARGLEQGNPILDKRVDNVGGGGAPCMLRIEDAAVSVRFVLRNEVFVGGETLSKDRMGEYECMFEKDTLRSYEKLPV